MDRLTHWDVNGVAHCTLGGDAAVENIALCQRLAAYEDTGLTPEEVNDHEEMFAAYRHVCGGKSPDDVAQVFAKNARLRAELAEQQRETASCDYLLGEAAVGARVAGGEIKELRSRLELAEWERDKAVEDINLVFGRVRALADCDGYHPYENVCDLCAFFDGGEKRECRGNCKNARWRETEGKA